MGIRLVHALPRHPQTGGRFEAFGKEIKSKLRAVLAEQPDLLIDDAIAHSVCLYK